MVVLVVEPICRVRIVDHLEVIAIPGVGKDSVGSRVVNNAVDRRGGCAGVGSSRRLSKGLATGRAQAVGVSCELDDAAETGEHGLG